MPLANYYSQIENFIETHSLFEYGQINQAFSAAIRRLLQVNLTIIIIIIIIKYFIIMIV